jgi:hypothetical protein
MKNAFKWVALGFVALVVIGAIAGGSSDNKKDSGSQAAATAADKPATTEDVAATTQEDAPPPPEPVSVAALGPFETTHDQVNLHGSVSPKGSKVSVNGQRASVQGGKWTKLVQIANKGDNTYKIVGSKPGHDKDSTRAIVTRKLNAAEKAAAVAAKRQAFIAQAADVPYNQLLAHPSRYEGKKAVYRGQIFQVEEDGSSTVILLSVTHDGYLDMWDDNVWVDYDGTIKGAKDDIITVYGTLTGTHSYDTQIGGNTTVPSIRAKYIVE